MSTVVCLSGDPDGGDVSPSRISTLICCELVATGKLGLAVQFLGGSSLVFVLDVQSQLVPLDGAGI
jgi:hypothetical protein